MQRLLALSALVLVAATGCRMCASPYDYCGPVVECGCMEATGGGPATGNCGCGGSAAPGDVLDSSRMMKGVPAIPSGETISPENVPAAPAPAPSTGYSAWHHSNPAPFPTR
jgi:hypothetical protein